MSGESREEFERDRFGTAGLVAKHPASDHEMLCEIWEATRKMMAALDEVCYRTATSSREEQEAHHQKVRREGGCAFCDAGDTPLGHLYHLTQEGRHSCGNCACAECAALAASKPEADKP